MRRTECGTRISLLNSRLLNTLNVLLDQRKTMMSVLKQSKIADPKAKVRCTERRGGSDSKCGAERYETINIGRNVP